MDKTITLHPRLSEKTYGLSEHRVYVVDVPKDVNKHGVARAIETQFDVKVTNVNISTVSGKTKRTMSLSGKRYLNSSGQRATIKKAYVTLATGNSLPFFAAIEEEEAQEAKTQEKFDKAAAKQATKETKKAPKAEAEPKAKAATTPARAPKKAVEAEVEAPQPEEAPKPRRGFRPSFHFRRRGNK